MVVTTCMKLAFGSRSFKTNPFIPESSINSWIKRFRSRFSIKVRSGFESTTDIKGTEKDMFFMRNSSKIKSFISSKNIYAYTCNSFRKKNDRLALEKMKEKNRISKD
jgi:hypothetical protein